MLILDQLTFWQLIVIYLYAYLVTEKGIGKEGREGSEGQIKSQ